MNIHIEHQKGPMGSFMLDVDGDCEQRNNRCSITTPRLFTLIAQIMHIHVQAHK